MPVSKRKKTVNVADIESVVARIARIPEKSVSQSDRDTLKNLGDRLKMLVFGQDKAIEALTEAIKMARAGLGHEHKPVGSFLFAGPTGVGKTEVTVQLSKALGIELLRFDMSEYMERHTVSRLIGAPPGYVGFDQGGLLTDAVIKHPHAVLLLDEIEKAHPDVFNILLQLLDDGQLTDSLGRKVDFKNTIVIMTSNIGSRQLKDFGRGIGFGSQNLEGNSEYARGVVQIALKNAFSPEFLNRIDDIIMFNPLTKEDIYKIIDIELKSLFKRVNDLGLVITISKEAKDFIIEKGYDPQYGARPLKRAIQKYLEDELAEVIIKGIAEGTELDVGYDKENDKLIITEKENK